MKLSDLALILNRRFVSIELEANFSEPVDASYCFLLISMRIYLVLPLNKHNEIL